MTRLPRPSTPVETQAGCLLVLGDQLLSRHPSADETVLIDYLTLLDATGRFLKAGKRGAIPAELAPILARLDLSADAWLATMLGWRMFAFTDPAIERFLVAAYALEPWDFRELNELLDLGGYTPPDRTRLVTTVAKSAPSLPDIVKLQLP